MDILCVGMHRSCSTWQYNICAEMVERKVGGQRLGFVHGWAYEPDRGADRAAWRVLKTHDGHDSFAAALREGRALAVYSRRDLRDVVFSLMHKHSRDFDDIVAPGGLLGDCIVADKFWPSLPNVLCQSYGDIVANPSAAVRAIAQHIGWNVTDAEVVGLSSAFSAEKNKERTEAFAAELRAGGVDLANPDNSLIFDAKSLFHWNHLRDGVIGGWRQLASPYQREVLAELCGAWLVEHGYESTPSGWVHAEGVGNPEGRGTESDQAVCSARGGRLPIRGKPERRAS